MNMSRSDHWESEQKMIYICSELSLTWRAKDLSGLVKLWNSAVDFRTIAKYLNRDADEIMIACIHLARIDQINSQREILVASAIFDNPRRQIVVCSDLNLVWEARDLVEITRMWNKGMGLRYMADYFNRDADEIMIACIHLARRNKITSRKLTKSILLQGKGA